MKKIILALLVGTFIMSCSSDDEGNTEINIEGNWKLTSFTSENNYDINEDGSASNNILIETACYENETIDFNSDGSGTVTSRSYADITLNLVTGSSTEYEYSVECVDELEETAFVWTENGNTITITGAGFMYDATFTATTMTFTIPDGLFLEVEEGGGTAVATEDITFVYTKQ
ncbi:MAG: DUF5004 domain-containing protein [Flavobacteriaceae bacterium]|nr:DUF5004 domain-containing protein [Flavobacteriaceae bacterium]